ncbi:unnamed protein product, partial [Didymodactylos carnosus]
MDNNFKTKLQRIIAYQDILTRNHHLSQRSCDAEFRAFLDFHNDLRRKYIDLKTRTQQLEIQVEQHHIDLSRKDKKIQSQSETTDLSDKNCTGEELEYERNNIPKVVSQTNVGGGIKRPQHMDDYRDDACVNKEQKRAKHED